MMELQDKVVPDGNTGIREIAGRAEVASTLPNSIGRGVSAGNGH